MNDWLPAIIVIAIVFIAWLAVLAILLPVGV